MRYGSNIQVTRSVYDLCFSFGLTTTASMGDDNNNGEPEEEEEERGREGGTDNKNAQHN